MSIQNEAKLPLVQFLILDLHRSVLNIWFNRPEARNALNDQMMSELGQVLDSIKYDRTIRTIVLRGKGGFFCAGGDIKGFKSGMQATDSNEVAKGNRSFGDVMTKLNEQPQVVIILVEGAAIGGGLGLACVADVTLVTAEAKFRLSETSLGIPPAQIAPFVTERVGLTQARRLMLTGAKFNGEEAARLGIAHGVASDASHLESQCNEILSQISACAPGANAVTKEILFESLRRPRPEVLDFASARFAQCMLSEEGLEGVAAFVEKRKASWNK
jgi:isohexenylglutaconyl-CoA hydratase